MGSAIRVRRSSDNAEQNIGFSGGNLDTAALSAFCGSSNGFVTTWYDQSGNGNNATQTTAVEQPQIVSSGTIITENGIPVVKNPAAGTLKRLISALSYIQPLPVTIFIAGRIITLPNNTFSNVAFFLGGTDNGGGGGRYESLANTSNFFVLRRNGAIVSTASYNTNRFIQSGYFQTSSLTGRQNGVDSASVSYTGTESTIPGTFQLMGAGGTQSQFCAEFSAYEYVIYLSDQYTNRAGIEQNINQYYAIY